MGVLLTDVRHLVADFVETNGELVLPVVFVGFFLFGFIALLKRGRARRHYVIGVIVLLSLSAVLALTVYPFTHGHRYSTMADQTGEVHEIRVVDLEGNELTLDPRATMPLRSDDLGSKLNGTWDNETRIQVAERILLNAEEHRTGVESPVPRLRHPPPSAGSYWDRTSLENVGVFASVRIYHVQWRYQENSHHVETKTSECVLEIDPQTRTVGSCTDV